MKKLEAGEIVTRKCRDRISRYQKQEDGTFKYVPNGLGKGGDRRSPQAKDRAKRFIPNNERPPIEKKMVYRTDVNPEKFTVKKDEGGKYVWDAEKRLWRLKKQLAA